MVFAAGSTVSHYSKTLRLRNVVTPSVCHCVVNQLLYDTSQQYLDVVASRTYIHWTAVSAARGASRAAKSVAKVTSSEEVLLTSGLLATAMEMPNIERILAVNITV